MPGDRNEFVRSDAWKEWKLGLDFAFHRSTRNNRDQKVFGLIEFVLIEKRCHRDLIFFRIGPFSNLVSWDIGRLRHIIFEAEELVDEGLSLVAGPSWVHRLLFRQEEINRLVIAIVVWDQVVSKSGDMGDAHVPHFRQVELFTRPVKRWMLGMSREGSSKEAHEQVGIGENGHRHFFVLQGLAPSSVSRDLVEGHGLSIDEAFHHIQNQWK